MILYTMLPPFTSVARKPTFGVFGFQISKFYDFFHKILPKLDVGTSRIALKTSSMH